MKNIFFFFFAAYMSIGCGNSHPLRFDKDADPVDLTMVIKGDTVSYQAYEKIYYVTEIEDSTYQYLNFYVPEGADENTPIILRTYVGGFMAAEARRPSRRDATGRALKEGYVVCIPGARGVDSKVVKDGREVFTGRAPAGILDLKAVVRYLKFNDDFMPGDAERIITDGTSAGGAMSSLLGSSGNSSLFEPYLKAMGAAKAKDDVYASVCYCPIVDLEHADMAYEWLYSCTNDGVRGLDEASEAVSEELAAAFPQYIDKQGLFISEGKPFTSKNALEYIESFIVTSANKALSESRTIPEGIGIIVKDGIVQDVDMNAYLSYVAANTRLKTPPAFDAKDVFKPWPTPENMLFGDASGSTVNFTPFTCSKTGMDITEDILEKIDLMNPMFHLNTDSAKAEYWYIRHGARDRDTGLSVPVMLSLKLQNIGLEVDFALPWDRGHEGDYDLDELFDWIRKITD